MADSEVLESTEESELDVLPDLDDDDDDDDRDTLTFSTNNSHELLVDLHGANEISSESKSMIIGLPSSAASAVDSSAVDQSPDMLGVDIVTLHQPSETTYISQTLQLPDGTVAVIKSLSQLPDKLQVVNLDGSVTLLDTSMLTAEDSISAEQLGLDSADVQCDETVGDEDNKTNEMYRLISSVSQFPSSVGTIEINPATSCPLIPLPSFESQNDPKKNFVCGFKNCFRRYTTLHHLKVHQRSHTGDRPYRCGLESCSKSFATSYALKSHRRVHTGEKPYECTACGCVKAFKTSGDLQKHIRTHTGEKPFMCPYVGCGRSFTTSNIRKVHIRTHTGERPYSCDMPGCGKTFASATNYKNHIRIHSGEKPYICTSEGCGKRFTEYSSLYKHHVVHTHKKPYECADCGRTYRQTSTLAMHRRMAHSVIDSATAMPSTFFLTTVSDKLLIDKNPVITFRVVEDGVRPLDDADGNLVIDTSDGHQLMEHYGDISVINTSDQCSIESDSLVSANTAVTSSVLGQLTASVGLNDKHEGGANRVFVVTDRPRNDALHV